MSLRQAVLEGCAHLCAEAVILLNEFIKLFTLQGNEDALGQRRDGSGGRDVREQRDFTEVVAVFECDNLNGLRLRPSLH